MNFIKLTPQNLSTEHICCAISSENDCQVSSKKAWLRERLEEGLVFLKGDVRGKCFIEYIPSEFAWVPVNAPGYTFINCLWVSGSLKGHGYASELLEECIRQSREADKEGIAILSSEKKKGFLADPSFLKHKGFLAADSFEPYFQLWYLPLKDCAAPPCFKHQPIDAASESDEGFQIYYTQQCPFTAKYVPLIVECAKEHNVALKATLITDTKQAQCAPCPYTAFSLYYNGQFITHEIPSIAKFEKLLAQKKLI